MTENLNDPVRRRCELVPPSLAGELLRMRLIDALDRRWSATVTTVVAGPGLGKSTALAQALRHNHARPRGIDGWVSCEPGDEDADHLAAAIVRSLGASFAGSDGVSAVLNALRATSPLPTCLVVDDLHLLPDSCSSIDLLGAVLAQLPAHAHLVLAGRSLPTIPLSRLRAADRVVDITQDDLTFTADEVATLAVGAGQDAALLGPLAGWPALVRLALVAPTGGTSRFMWEEVVSRLVDDDRRALLAVATLGTADATTLADLCGHPVDLVHLVDTIPMVSHTGDGRIRAHDLWYDALASLLPPDEVASVGRAAASQLLAQGSFVRAGSLAARLGAGDALCAAARQLVRNTLSALPVDTASAWLRAAPETHRDRPELVLLDAVVRHALGPDDASIDASLETALVGFRARGDEAGEVEARAFQLVLAHTRGDLAGAIAVAGATAHLVGADRDPALRVLAPMITSTEAHLVGDVERAADVLGAVRVAGLPPTIAEAVVRLHWHMLLFAGRAGEASQLDPAVLANAPTPNACLFVPFAQWLNGDPSGLLGAGTPALDEYESRQQTIAVPYARDWFNHGIFTALVFASLGDRAVVARAGRLAASMGLDCDGPRNGAPIAIVEALQAVLDHDDGRATDVVDAFIARHPLSDQFASACLRRFLVVPYVCSAEARARWDADRLGPAHRLQRDVASALLAARRGELLVMPPPAAVLTALPLPWSVELAVRAEAQRHPDACVLAQWLVDRLGDVVCDELRYVQATSDVAMARAAGDLLSTVSMPPAQHTRLELLGPLRVLVDGQPVDRPELRRARVRELLALLVLEGVVSRERAMDVLWTDLAPADAARNLRVTLTHLRKLLEPERGVGTSGYHLRADAVRLRLVPSDRLSIDVWEIKDHLDAVASSTGDPSSQIDHLTHAVQLWAGEPLGDLERSSGFDHELEHLRLRLVDATLTLGELLLAQGRDAVDPAAALRCADRALAAQPYDERALRLGIAAHLVRGDRARARAAGRRMLHALDDLGVTPDERTTIVLRQAGLEAGTLVPSPA